MSEMEWEDPPALNLHVPRVRNWWTPMRYGLGHAVLRWPRHVLVPIVFLPIIWVIALFLAAACWAFSLAMLVPYGLWAIAECVTYRKRCERAALRTWGPYMGELHGEGT